MLSLDSWGTAVISRRDSLSWSYLLPFSSTGEIHGVGGDEQNAAFSRLSDLAATTELKPDGLSVQIFEEKRVPWLISHFRELVLTMSHHQPAGGQSGSFKTLKRIAGRIPPDNAANEQGTTPHDVL